ncbi:MAG TPA: hypothetical protein VGN26_02205 [Armatimonadota bacterium]|jgi:hypothetical protein
MALQTTAILDREHLSDTLWNLEEARLKGVPADHPGVCDALDWVASRAGLPGAYKEGLHAPTEADYSRRWYTPTGENGSPSGAGLSHVLAEESLRALALWRPEQEWGRHPMMLRVRDRFGAMPYDHLGSPGTFCCARCSVARWRALAAGRPQGWDEVVSDGLRSWSRECLESGHWSRYPYYYTLLALSELPLAQVQGVRSALRASAERRIGRLSDTDQQSRFRKRALEWVLA